MNTVLPDRIDLVFETHYKPLCVFANKILQNQEAAEDVVQELFVKLCERPEVLPDEITDAKRYLYAAVRNNCLKEIRIDKKWKNYIDSTIWDEIDESTFIDAIVYAEVMTQLREAVETLPKGCATVLRMAVFESFTNEEIATALNLSIHTVRSQKNRAISLLKEKVDPRTFLFLLLFFITDY